MPDHGEVFFGKQLRGVLERLNADLPVEWLDNTFRKLTRPEGTTLEAHGSGADRIVGAKRPGVCYGDAAYAAMT